MNLLHEQDVRALSANRLVPIYLVAGILYEHHDNPCMTDGAWEALCKRLDQEWDAITHRHKIHIAREEMATGTASYLKQDELPKMILGSADIFNHSPYRWLEHARKAQI